MQTLTPRFHRPAASGPTSRGAFTLVELLVAVLIILIILGLLSHAIIGLKQPPGHFHFKVEIISISQAIEDYKLHYGEYPPDFSSWDTVERHYRRIFPKIAESELELLRSYLSKPDGAFDPNKIDRAEALVFTLGGYGSDNVHPLSKGPLVLIDADLDPSDISNYQYNPQRTQMIYEFAPDRLTLAVPDPASPISKTNRFESTDEIKHYGANRGDLTPSYLAIGRKTSYVYFASETYGSFNAHSGFNAFRTIDHGGVRPYLASNPTRRPRDANDFSSASDALASWEFTNPETFQIISAGEDAHFGHIPEDTIGGRPPTPVYFVFPTGDCVSLHGAIRFNQPRDLLEKFADVHQYDDRAIWPGAKGTQIDNVTNFSRGSLRDDLE